MGRPSRTTHETVWIFLVAVVAFGELALPTNSKKFDRFYFMAELQTHKSQCHSQFELCPSTSVHQSQGANSVWRASTDKKNAHGYSS